MIETFFIIIVCIFSIFISLNISKEKKKISVIKKELGISDGKIVYTDLDKLAQPIFSDRLRLVGKPDYILKRNGFTIPIEVKTLDTDSPYRNHILQLIVYCC